MTHTPPRHNRRRAFRVPLRVEIHREGQPVHVDYAINISPGGVCVQSDQPGELGEVIRVRFRLEPGAKELEADAEIVWRLRDCDLGPGIRYGEMGLRFVSISDEMRGRLQEFIEQHALGAGE